MDSATKNLVEYVLSEYDVVVSDLGIGTNTLDALCTALIELGREQKRKEDITVIRTILSVKELLRHRNCLRNAKLYQFDESSPEYGELLYSYIKDLELKVEKYNKTLDK